jgi:hypothetical protein
MLECTRHHYIRFTHHYSTSAFQLHVIDSRGIDRSIPGNAKFIFANLFFGSRGISRGIAA